MLTTQAVSEKWAGLIQDEYEMANMGQEVQVSQHRPESQAGFDVKETTRDLEMNQADRTKDTRIIL